MLLIILVAGHPTGGFMLLGRRETLILYTRPFKEREGKDN